MIPSALYASGAIAVRSSRNLLTKTHIRNMINAGGATDAAKILEEVDYNREIINTNPENDDLIIADERARTVKTFRELCGDRALLYCVMAKYEYHNLKTLYKARTLNNLKKSTAETLYPFAVHSFDMNRLPIPLRSAVRTLESRAKFDTAEIDLGIDMALYQDISANVKNIKTRSIADWFRAEIDIVNLRTYFKCRALKLNGEDFFVKGGLLKPSTIKTATGNDENSKEALRGTPYAALQLTSIDDFESSAAEYLVQKSTAGKNNINTLAPLFHWYVLKQEEFKAVKTILMGKRFGFSKEKTRDNLRGVYDKFE